MIHHMGFRGGSLLEDSRFRQRVTASQPLSSPVRSPPKTSVGKWT